MKRIIQFLLLPVFFLVVVGCEPIQQGQQEATVRRPDTLTSGAGRIKDTWIDTSKNTEDIILDDNLLRNNFCVVFDGSGSMGGNKVEAAKVAVKKFGSLVSADSNLGLVVFDTKNISERVPLGTENRDEFNSQVDNIRAGDGTPLTEATSIAYSSLIEQAYRQLGYGEYHIVIVTDGAANRENRLRVLLDQILDKSPVIIHTMGFQIGPDHTLNQPGRMIYREAYNLKDLEAGLSDVLSESTEF